MCFVNEQAIPLCGEDSDAQEHLQKFLQKKQQALEEKERKEAEATQAAAAKKAAKKRASQAQVRA